MPRGYRGDVDPRFPLVAALAVAVATEGHAAAGPVAAFLDGNFGSSSPRSDARYTDTFKTSMQLGFRTGALLQLRAGEDDTPRVLLGLDLGADHTTLDHGPDDGTTFTRWRMTAGPRLALQLPNVELFARAGVGIERIHMGTTGLLEALCGDPTIQSAAFDGAVGVGVTFHHVIIGAQFGAGVSNHRDDRPACQPVNGQDVYVDVLDTRNVDLNAQLFLGVRL